MLGWVVVGLGCPQLGWVVVAVGLGCFSVLARADGLPPVLSDSRLTTPLRAPAYFHIGVWVGESLSGVVFVFCELRYVVLIGSSAAWVQGGAAGAWGSLELA